MTTSNGSTSNGSTSRPARLLIVDDHGDTRRLYRYLLDQRGFSVDLFADPHDALACAEENTHDGYLVDISLGSDIDGFDVLDQLRRMHQSQSRPEPPVIAVTAHALPGDEKRCLDAGFDAYVSKPFTSQALCSVLDEHLHSGDQELEC